MLTKNPYCFSFSYALRNEYKIVCFGFGLVLPFSAAEGRVRFGLGGLKRQ